MKKFYISFCIVVLVLGFLGNAKAIPFTNITPLWEMLHGTGSTSWTHATPSDLEVPYDIVNIASLLILANYSDGINDKIDIEGQWTSTVIANDQVVWTGGWNNPFVGTLVNLTPVFNSWPTPGELLNIQLDYSGSEGYKYVFLKESYFFLDYNNIDPTTVPVPEPETMLMLGSVLLGLVAVTRKRFNDRT